MFHDNPVAMSRSLIRVQLRSRNQFCNMRDDGLAPVAIGRCPGGPPGNEFHRRQANFGPRMRSSFPSNRQTWIFRVRRIRYNCTRQCRGRKDICQKHFTQFSSLQPPWAYSDFQNQLSWGFFTIPVAFPGFSRPSRKYSGRDPGTTRPDISEDIFGVLACTRSHGTHA